MLFFLTIKHVPQTSFSHKNLIKSPKNNQWFSQKDVTVNDPRLREYYALSTGKQLLSFRRGLLLTSSGCSSPNVEPVLGLVDPEERGAKPIRSESNTLPVNTVVRPRKHQHLSTSLWESHISVTCYSWQSNHRIKVNSEHHPRKYLHNYLRGAGLLEKIVVPQF
jgi:hypothetical protein